MHQLVLGKDRDVLTLMIDTPLTKVLGDKTAKAMAKHLNLHTADDLLLHLPRRYAKRGELTPISNLPVGELVTVNGVVRQVRERPLKGRKGSILEVVVGDGTSVLTLTFFNQGWRKNELRVGATGLFSGKITRFQSSLQLAHPDYELFAEDVEESDAAAWAELPIPIYPASSTLPSWKISKAVDAVIGLLDSAKSPVAESLIAEHGVVSLVEAVRLVHRPDRDADWMRARESLRFHEALILQLQLAKRRHDLAELGATVRKPGGMLMEFDKRLPFELTAGQMQVGSEIEADMASGHPMQRLLQGEVGSGKTLVAARAVLVAAESGGQSAFLAPTEVLAQQHYFSLRETFGADLSDRLGMVLLTGKMSAAERKRVLLDLASGKSLLVVGTHAILSEKVSFFDLALTVVDEQHRFGVRQRSALSAKANQEPHLLLMTATPIPRSVAISIFGDLQVSELRELPSGRAKIQTHLVPLDNQGLVSRVWQRAAEEVAAGRQVFVVCPKIRGSEGEVADATENPISDAIEEFEEVAATPEAAAEDIIAALRLNPALAGCELGLLHGQLTPDEKQAVMTAFLANEIGVLVATTVIEVGVNVPNATMMVVLNAEHFGIAQLHQLRGRVGRGNHAGLCVLVTNAQPGSVAHERLSAVCASTDGFELSERDLDIRGEGDVLGDTQSGRASSLRVLRVVQDAALIQEVRQTAEQLYQTGLSSELAQLLQASEDADAIARS